MEPAAFHDQCGDGEIDRVRMVLDSHAVHDGSPTRLWITEFGYTLCPGQPMTNTEADQNTKLQEAIRQVRATAAVEKIIWYSFHDYPGKCMSDGGTMRGLCIINITSGQITHARSAFTAFNALALHSAAYALH